MENFTIIIDNREIKLIEQFKKVNFIHLSENLDIGDILIKYDSEPFLIIERKTIDDLKSSICDGRLREQRYRLLNASRLPSNRIMYIIEGNTEKSSRLLKSEKRQVDNSIVIGSIINMIFRDNIKIHRTNSIEETSEFIIKLFSKVKDIFKFKNEVEQESKIENKVSSEETKIDKEEITYTSTIHKRKKDNMTPQNWFICQLSMIPQISDKIAIVITNEYPTLLSLILKYQSITENERPNLLSELTFDLKTGKKRKIGKTISSRVYEYIYKI